jgi:hypothetical protein
MASAALTVSPTLTPIFEHDAIAIALIGFGSLGLNQTGASTHG